MKKQNTTTKSEQTKTEQAAEPIMNEQLNAEQTTPTEVVNPFANLAAAVSTSKSSRKLAYTDKLQTKAREMTTALIGRTSKKDDPDYAALCQAGVNMQQAKTPETLLAFIKLGYTDTALTEAAAVLDGCDEDDLAKMLESQRSNRSKAKKACKNNDNIWTTPNMISYISSMIAELLIRVKTGKAYAVGGGKLETDHDKLAVDKEALVKRINSLASKQSRLRPLANLGDAKAKTKLAEVEKELAELRAMRPGKTKTVVKSVSVDQVRAGINSGAIDPAALQALLDAMKAAGQTEQVEQVEEQVEAQTEQALANELGA